MKIVVVGAGAMGSLASRALALRGHDVVGLERFSLGHANGSSHGESRIIRRTYPDRLHTRLMDEAYRHWETLQEDAGAELWVRTGILYFGPADHPEISAVAGALDAEGVPFRRLHPGAARADHGLCLDGNEVAIWQEDGGYVRAGDVVRHATRLAERAGARWKTETRVLSIAPDGPGVVVETDLGAFHADRVVVCAGAWIGELLSDTPMPLRVTRQTFAYVTSDREPASAPDLVWIDAATYWYGFPADGRLPGVKLAQHRPHGAADPDRVDRTVSERERDQALAVARRRIPGARAVVDAATCLYTNTPDERFILDHALGGRAVIVSACSGHGFKFAPLVADLAADAVESGAWRADLTPFAASRFQSPKREN